MDTRPQADLVVIGGGVVGAATAWHAARAGLRPVIVEARPALCTLTTPVAAGAFRLQFDNLEELTLVRSRPTCSCNFEDRTEQRRYSLGVRQQGYLWLTTTSRDGRARSAELVARLAGLGPDRRRAAVRRRGPAALPVRRSGRRPGALPRRRRLPRHEAADVRAGRGVGRGGRPRLPGNRVRRPRRLDADGGRTDRGTIAARAGRHRRRAALGPGGRRRAGWRCRSSRSAATS